MSSDACPAIVKVNSVVAPSLIAMVEALEELYQIPLKRARGEKMRKPGQKGAPTAQDFIESAKTAKK